MKRYSKKALNGYIKELLGNYCDRGYRRKPGKGFIDRTGKTKK